MSGPFSDIRDWQHAIARWDDLVTPTLVEPSTASADLGRISAVGDITLVVLATGVTVRAVLRLAYTEGVSREDRVSYAVGNEVIHGTEIEETVALIVARARRMPPPPTGRYRRRRP